MIVSRARKFVFVHIPKSAGTSIRAALEPYADEDAARHAGTTHETLSDFLARNPDMTGHFKFAFVRNPWERLVSLFAYAKAVLAPTYPQFQMLDSVKAMLRLLDRNTPWLSAMHGVRPQREFVRGVDGAMLADYVGRYETLKDDFRIACERAGIEPALTWRNASRHEAYAQYYDGWSRDFVAARYRQDIQEFGYTFEAVT